MKLETLSKDQGFNELLEQKAAEALRRDELETFSPSELAHLVVETLQQDVISLEELRIAYEVAFQQGVEAFRQELIAEKDEYSAVEAVAHAFYDWRKQYELHGADAVIKPIRKDHESRFQTLLES